jgi:hypothetical protein
MIKYRRGWAGHLARMEASGMKTHKEVLDLDLEEYY